MYRSRPVPPPNQWILIPRPDWHFPTFIPPAIGPRLPLPLRPRVLPYKLRRSQLKNLKSPTVAAMHRVSNPLVNKLFQKHPILDKIFTQRTRNALANPFKNPTSRVVPRTLPPPKFSNELWKRGWRMPAPSAYTIGCRRPVKLFDLPTQEFHFRLVHPQFGKFFDKWAQKDINWDDLRNHELMKKDLRVLVDRSFEANAVRKNFGHNLGEANPASSGTSKSVNSSPSQPRSVLIRPMPFAGFMEKNVLFAHLQEQRFLDKINFAKDPKKSQELLEAHQDRASVQIVEAYHNSLKLLREQKQAERLAKVAKMKDREKQKQQEV